MRTPKIGDPIQWNLGFGDRGTGKIVSVTARNAISGGYRVRWRCTECLAYQRGSGGHGAVYREAHRKWLVFLRGAGSCICGVKHP